MIIVRKNLKIKQNGYQYLLTGDRNKNKSGCEKQQTNHDQGYEIEIDRKINMEGNYVGLNKINKLHLIKYIKIISMQ